MTGTTCLLPISTYLPGDLDLPTDDSGLGTQPPERPDLDALRAEPERIDELDALRQRKAVGQ